MAWQEPDKNNPDQFRILTTPLRFLPRDTRSHQEKHLCQIILKSTHSWRSKSLDKYNVDQF